MAFSESEQVRRRTVNETFTGNGTGTNTTFGIRGEFIVAGTFNATATLQAKSEGDDVIIGEWVTIFTTTSPALHSFRFYKDRPMRVVITGYASGEVNTFLEQADTYIEER